MTEQFSAVLQSDNPQLEFTERPTVFCDYLADGSF